MRMPVDQKIAVRGIFILADARFDQRRIGEGGETLAQHRAGFAQSLLRDFAIAGFGIELRTMGIERDFESAAVERGDRIDAFTKRDPRRQTFISGRRAEEKNFLARGADAAAQDFGK